MIVSWMLHSILVAALLALAAKALERALRLAGRPGRWAWVAALAGAVLVPAASLVLAARGSGVVAGVGPVVPVATPEAAPLGELGRGLADVAGPLLAGLEGPLLRLWAVATGALLVLFGASAVRLGRFRRRWSERIVDGGPVLVSEDVGPAVLGLLRPRVVVPGWVVQRGPESRGLILAHEREHCRSRDPLLVFLCALPAVLMPWNVALWWCLARLRLAVEMDCDERVLRRATPGARRRYGRLLVEVGRRPAGPVLAWAAFSERRSALERRVRALTERTPEPRAGRMVGLGAVVLLALAAACGVPTPDAPTSALDPDISDTLPAVGDVAAAGASGPAFTPWTDSPALRNLEEVERTLERSYPPLLRDAGIGGAVDVWLFVDREGLVRERRIHRSSGHPQLDDAALRVADVMRFTPARNGDEVVAVWIVMPIRFQLAPGGPAPAPREAPGIEIPPGPGEEPRALPPPPEPLEGDVGDRPVFTPWDVPPQATNGDEVQRALQREYPPLLRDAGIGGTAEVWVFIDEGGVVRNARLNESSGSPQLDEAALRVAPTMRFTPARNRGTAVPVWVSIPIQFAVR